MPALCSCSLLTPAGQDLIGRNPAGPISVYWFLKTNGEIGFFEGISMRGIISWFSGRSVSLDTNIVQSVGLLILRVWVGLMMAFGHGWGKLAGFSERVASFADSLGVGSHISLSLAVFAEFFCALLLVLGFFTRGVVIPLIINMSVAAFVIHGDDPFGRKELALLYLAVFAAVFFMGPGRYSIDRFLARK
jgi:putative oxidoreductase